MRGRTVQRIFHSKRGRAERLVKRLLRAVPAMWFTCRGNEAAANSVAQTPQSWLLTEPLPAAAVITHDPWCARQDVRTARLWLYVKWLY